MESDEGLTQELCRDGCAAGAPVVGSLLVPPRVRYDYRF